jgi:hypothetical protein
MTQARSLLLERFDGDVRRRLRLAGQQAREALERRREEARALTASVLGDAGEPTRGRLVQAAAAVRSRAQDAISYVALDASALPSRLARLAGSEGWWFAYKFELGGLRPEERIVHLILVKNGETYRALPLEDADHFAHLPAEEETTRRPAPVSVSVAQEQALQAIREELVRAAERKSAAELDVQRERADRYAEDCLLESREALEKARREWEAARKAVLATDEPHERAKARAHAERLEREYRKKLASLRNDEETRYALKDRNAALLAQRAKATERRTLLGSAYFWLG